LILVEKPISTMQMTYATGQTVGTAGIGLFFDATGCWHGGAKGDFKNYRMNVAFLDGHAKNLGFAEYQSLWSSRIE
jgi:prepilin-type processing-associated H-X9-DG protein